MITTIYVDMDGVLSDFDGRYFDLFQVRTKNVSKVDYDNNWLTFIANDCFSTLKEAHESVLLVNHLRYLESEGLRICILSSTGGWKYYNEISRQKTMWLENHSIFWPRIFVPGKTFKEGYIRNHSVLIDDHPENVKPWNDNIYNNTAGILHKDNMRETLAKLDTYLEGSS